MEKWKQIKVKHHYVWEYYLKNWAIDNKIFWLTTKGNVAHDSPKGMCREDGFYKVSVLDEVDVAYILEWSKQSPESLQREHRKTLEPFLLVSRLVEQIRASKIGSDELMACEEALLFNTLENHYCGVESGAKDALEGLTRGDLSVLEDKNVSIGLYSYLGHQVTRTKAVKERFFDQSLRKMFPSEELDEVIHLTEKNWWLICFLLGENIGWSLYSSRHEENLMLIKNTTDTPFITCDSPVVNIHPNNDNRLKGESPECLDILFPISPWHVLIIATSMRWNFLKGGAGLKDVSDLNGRIAASARFSIYGNTRSVIDENKKDVGAW
jgi:hypothetical protein